VDVDAPSGREVLIRTVASGVCHSDYHLMDGSRPAGAYATVLGHESAGVVEAVGPEVTAVRVGDHVVSCISGFCGACEQCLSGHPNLCVEGFTNRDASLPPRLSQDGRPLEQFFGIGAYAEQMLLHENSIVAIDREYPLESAALVGCAVLSGLGAVFRTAEVRAGETVAVFGCGGVGLSIVQGARIAGAQPIIAVDRLASKLEMATSMGATDTVDASAGDGAAAIRELTQGRGVDHAFEAVGSIALIRQASTALAIRGTLTVVGVPPTGSVLEIPWSAIRPECRVQTSRMGSNRFRFDIPRYLEFYRQGSLQLDELISQRLPLAQINEGFEAMLRGDVARTIIEYGG
jgi:S-(hydroxymethyl)glutathione dehydrogenase/alcohol dehydrogenase